MITKGKAIDLAILALEDKRKILGPQKIMFELYAADNDRAAFNRWHEYDQAIQILGALKNPTKGLPLFDSNDTAT